ncbi:GNAT family N-acetyltransferase [Robertmurraya sp. P23]|uniref:GNAT family N-acetyltransferase n=1 Tax=Robertmurraya sp. P23 TaxID=3436931 RepID=UPI003D951D6F
MKIKTVGTWDDELWQDASHLYLEAFGDKGAKPVHIIKNMFAQGIAELHVGYNESVAVVMALTGKLVSDKVMIIDYLAVSEKERGYGLGKYLVDYLRQKAASNWRRAVCVYQYLSSAIVSWRWEKRRLEVSFLALKVLQTLHQLFIINNI